MPRALRLAALSAAGLAALLPAAPAAASPRDAVSARASFPVVNSVAPRYLRAGQVLTIRGRGFIAGNRRNTVVFRAPGRGNVFVRAGRSSRTRMQVRVPRTLTAGVRGAPHYVQMRMRVLSRRLSRRWTSSSRSPRIAAPPRLTLPGDQTVEAQSAWGSLVSYTATVTDLGGVKRPASCSRPSGSGFAIGTTKVSCRANAPGGPVTGSFTVSVVDRTGPALHLPSDMTVEPTDSGGAEVDYAASAVDLVDGAVPVWCRPGSGTKLPIGRTTVDCTAVDHRGNRSDGSFTITVSDGEAPVVNVPGDMTVEATGPSGASVTFAAFATDAVDGNVPVTCSSDSGSEFPLGVTTVTCSATDSAGNTGTASFKIDVVDTTPPDLQVPDDMTVTADDSGNAVVNYVATANDLVSGSITPTCTPPSGSTFPTGTTTVTCTAVDGAGNKATATFDVNVVPPSGG